MLEGFYGLLDEVAERCGGPRRLCECDGKLSWPERGVYFFFEPGERRANSAERVVRVGTHALGARSKTTLWHRLSTHRGTIGGSLPGGGNHRGSVFRLHVGASLLARGGWPDGIRDTWGKGTSAPVEVRRAEHELECAVSDYIGNMSVLWVNVDDEPGPSSDRARIEVGAIVSLSNRNRPLIDPPSAGWLGHDAQRVEIQESGLWNVQHVDETPRAGFLGMFEAWLSGRHATSAATFANVTFDRL